MTMYTRKLFQKTPLPLLLTRKQILTCPCSYYIKIDLTRAIIEPADGVRGRIIGIENTSAQ